MVPGRVHYPIMIKRMGTIKWEACPSLQKIEGFCGTWLSQDLRMRRRHLSKQQNHRGEGTFPEEKPHSADQNWPFVFLLLGFGNWSSWFFFFKPPFLLAYFPQILKNSLYSITLTFCCFCRRVIYPLQVYLLLSSSTRGTFRLFPTNTPPSICSRKDPAPKGVEGTALLTFPGPGSRACCVGWPPSRGRPGLRSAWSPSGISHSCGGCVSERARSARCLSSDLCFVACSGKMRDPCWILVWNLSRIDSADRSPLLVRL